MNNLDKILYSTISKLRRINIIPVIIMTSFLFACSNSEDGTSTVVSSKNGGGITIPSLILATTLPNGAVRGFITVDDTLPRLAMDLSSDPATITIPNLAPGSHTFTIEFEFDSTTFGGTFKLASATKSFDLVEGGNSILFAESDYDLSYDNDKDGITNIAELAASTNPGDSTCILDSSLLDGCVLG